MRKIVLFSIAIFAVTACVSYEKENENQPHSYDLAGTVWKLAEVKNSETFEIQTRLLDVILYVIEFYEDGTVAFPQHCNYSSGNYTAYENGNIEFSGFLPGTEKYCPGISDLEDLIIRNFAMQPVKYQIHSNGLTIVCGKTTFIFQEFVQQNGQLSNSEWQIDPNFLGLDKNVAEYNLHREGDDYNRWGNFVRFTDNGQFISFDRQECGNSCFTKVYGKYSLPAADTLIISVDSVNINCSMANGEDKTEIRKGEEIYFKILNFSTYGFQLKKIEQDYSDSLSSNFWVSVDNLQLDNFKLDTVYVVNDWNTLRQHPYFSQKDNFYINYPSLDFSTQSVMINYFSGCMFCDVQSAFSNIDGYRWEVIYYFNQDITCVRAANFMVYKVVPKIPANANVELNATSVACTDEPTSQGNVLMLKVDYLTNTFEGGYEFSFDNVPNAFSIKREYKSPGDFGYVKYFYSETGVMLFHGTIIWMGEGKIYYPENLLPASAFDASIAADFVGPGSGFENIGADFSSPEEANYTAVWLHVQNLVKVREYLRANPGQTVKIFLYTPCVGIGNPEHWDWILFLKK